MKKTMASITVSSYIAEQLAWRPITQESMTKMHAAADAYLSDIPDLTDKDCETIDSLNDYTKRFMQFLSKIKDKRIGLVATHKERDYLATTLSMALLGFHMKLEQAIIDKDLVHAVRSS